jgi:hypothetical protein
VAFIRHVMFAEYPRRVRYRKEQVYRDNVRIPSPNRDFSRKSLRQREMKHEILPQGQNVEALALSSAERLELATSRPLCCLSSGLLAQHRGKITGRSDQINMGGRQAGRMKEGVALQRQSSRAQQRAEGRRVRKGMVIQRGGEDGNLPCRSSRESTKRLDSGIGSNASHFLRVPGMKEFFFSSRSCR